MFFDKIWRTIKSQFNKLANAIRGVDPIAEMQYEYDRSVEQLKEGRAGLEQYRGLVERVTRQVAANRSQTQKLEAETKAYLKAGDAVVPVAGAGHRIHLPVNIFVTHGAFFFSGVKSKLSIVDLRGWPRPLSGV